MIDLEDEYTIASAAEKIAEHSGKINLIIVATGILHDGAAFQLEKSWRALRTDQLERAFKINTIGPLLVSRHFLPLLDRDAKSVFAVLSARVGSIKDNQLGGWYGYRASKAALNMSVETCLSSLDRNTPARNLPFSPSGHRGHGPVETISTGCQRSTAAVTSIMRRKTFKCN